MSALRVLFDFSLASDESAGPRTVMDGLLRGWAEAHPQDRVTLFGPASLHHRAVEFNVDFVQARLGIPPRRILQQQLELPVRRLGRSADVVIVPNLVSTVVAPGAPVIGTLCDVRHLRRPSEFSRPQRMFRGAVWSAAARRMSAVASISEFSLHEADHFGFPLPAERAVVPLGLDHLRRAPAPVAKKNSVVCISHRSSKGLSVLPAVWAGIQAEMGVERPALTVTGIPPDRHPLVARMMTDAGVVDGFHISEFLPEDDLHRIISESRAVLYLSAYEGYGFVPSEATVLGTHSFVFDLPPYRERASQLSITAVPVGDIAALVSELTRFLQSSTPTVLAEPPPRWAETAEAYRDLVGRVVRS